ncbi:MAG TPA: response regulator [Nannocystaceae bacterium]|nr:response regulator [Nannocystaceae bacterium]
MRVDVPADSSSAPGRCKVLVVDDDEDLRELVCASLEAEGYVVHAAGDGHAALDRLRGSELPDLVLLDLEMPVMSGWEVVRYMQSVHRYDGVPVIVMSGVAPEDAPDGVTFLHKPASVNGLLAAVQRETLARRRPHRTRGHRHS